MTVQKKTRMTNVLATVLIVLVVIALVAGVVSLFLR